MAQDTAKPAPKRPLKDQVHEVMALIDTFSALLLKETAALKKADFPAVDALQAEKKTLATEYNTKITALADRREEWPQLEPALREKLVAQRDAFSALLNDNMQALERTQNSIKRLVNNILEAARKALAEEQQTNYSSAGQATTYKSASTSLSTDQVL